MKRLVILFFGVLAMATIQPANASGMVMGMAMGMAMASNNSQDVQGCSIASRSIAIDDAGNKTTTVRINRDSYYRVDGQYFVCPGWSKKTPETIAQKHSCRGLVNGWKGGILGLHHQVPSMNIDVFVRKNIAKSAHIVSVTELDGYLMVSAKTHENKTHE